MDKRLIAVILAAALLTGCSGNADSADLKKSQISLSESQATADKTEGDLYKLPQSEAVQLESGLTAIRFDGDYSF